MGRTLLAASALSVAACASHNPTPRPFPQPRPAIAEPAPPVLTPGHEASALVDTALALRGVPYRNGGTDPNGFDCSGFVAYVFGQHGIAMPRTVDQQFRFGLAPGDTLQPGDLVFFSTIAPGASHVGIAIGGDAFVHAPSSSGEVRVERLSAPYWAARYVGARRIL